MCVNSSLSVYLLSQDPELELKVESQFEGRDFPQLSSFLESQVHLYSLASIMACLPFPLSVTAPRFIASHVPLKIMGIIISPAISSSSSSSSSYGSGCVGNTLYRAPRRGESVGSQHGPCNALMCVTLCRFKPFFQKPKPQNQLLDVSHCIVYFCIHGCLLCGIWMLCDCCCADIWWLGISHFSLCLH